jgi:hypothetical protein
MRFAEYDRMLLDHLFPVFWLYNGSNTKELLFGCGIGPGEEMERNIIHYYTTMRPLSFTLSSYTRIHHRCLALPQVSIILRTGSVLSHIHSRSLCPRGGIVSHVLMRTLKS